MLLQSKSSIHNFQSVLQNSPSAIFAVDSNLKVKYWNPTAEALFGWKKEEVYEQHLPIIPDLEADTFETIFRDIISGKSLSSFHAKRLTKDGSIIDVLVTPLPWYDDDKKIRGYIALISDISEYKYIEDELRNQKERIERITYSDHLTSLPNRKLFEDELRKRIKVAKNEQTTFGLMYFDLDGFKYINDTLGPKIGDKLIKEVALRLNQKRKASDFIARIGGDEFVMIISNINSTDEIHHFAKEVLHLFEYPFHIDHYELFITTSIGICFYPNGGNSANDLIKNADLAMFRAKDEGKNKYEIFAPTMNVSTFKQFSLRNDLRKAVQENMIFLYFQPRIDSKSNKIVGAEALARWKHPEWGIVSPDEFISLAEESGLINTIGEQLLLQACRQNKKWQDDGHPPIKISVNFSALQFLQANIVDTIETILYTTGLDPKWLEIEITETTVMKNEDVILFKLEQLREMGISIAVDDFGTGYSSLSYLKKLNPDTVKIDKSFIQQIPTDKENTEIASAIINLADKLKMNVVAEGVETNEQFTYLRKIHCGEIQGYLFSKPVSVEVFEKLLKKETLLPHTGIVPKDSTLENRREFYRIDLPQPLLADMTIASIGGKQVKLGKTKVLIEDIGPGGVRFSSDIKLPPRPDLILKIKTFILHKPIELTGTIVWAKEVQDYQQYGLQFDIYDNQREALTSLLNQFQMKLRQNILSSSSFVTTSRNYFFKNKLSS